MTDHDPLCQWADRDHDRTRCAECVLIASVRADEREQIAQAIEADLSDLADAPGYRPDLGTGMTIDGLRWAAEKGTVPWDELIDPVILSPGWEPTDG